MKLKKTFPWSAMLTLVLIMVSANACRQKQVNTSIPGTENISGKQHDWRQLTAEAELASKRGNREDAEDTYKAAIEVAEKLGTESLASQEAVANLANFYYVQGEADRAGQLYKKRLSLREKTLGLEHVDLVVDLVRLGHLCSSQKRYFDARAYYRRAISILKRAGRDVPHDLEVDYENMQKLSSGKVRRDS